MLLICVLDLDLFGFRRCWLTFAPLFRSISQTDRTGCATHFIRVSAFGPRDQTYRDMFEVTAEMEEYGTGRFMNEIISCFADKTRHCQCWCQIMTVACIFCRGGHSSQWPNALLC